MTLLEGYKNTPYDPPQTLAVSIVPDPDGTNRVAVSPGIPLLGQVTSFLSVFRLAGSGVTTLYTAPGNKTFYVTGIVLGNADTTFGHGYDFTIGSTEFKGAVPAGGTLTITAAPYPIGIVQSGQTIAIVAGFGANEVSGTFTGYEIFGATT